MKPVFLTASWQKLIMANYEIDPLVLSPYLPAHTILDDFEGKYFVSLVGFLLTMFVSRDGAFLTTQTAQLTHEYEVAHPSWQHYPVKEYDIVCDFEKVYGKAFAFLNLQKPASVFVAEGSEVVIHHKRVLKG